jgi:hypothetical protein
MPRVLVTTNDRNHAILLDEPVSSEHLEEGSAADQLIERLAWSIDDAERAEAARRMREAIGPRTGARTRAAGGGTARARRRPTH